MITTVTGAPVGLDQNKLRPKEPVEVRRLSYGYVTHWHMATSLTLYFHRDAADADSRSFFLLHLSNQLYHPFCVQNESYSEIK